MSGFFKTVFIILIVIYALRFLGRIFGPWLARKAQSKMKKMAEEQMRQRGFNANPQQPDRPEGSVTVEKTTKKTSKKSYKGSDDEYVDYEIIE
ncbi:MAG: DUF4834 family protein [Flavobacteriales bacterium]